MKELLDAKDAELRNVNRNLKTAQNERDNFEKLYNEQKKTSAGHFQDLKKERERKSEETIRLTQSTESLRNEIRKLKSANHQMSVQKDREICQLTIQETERYRNFVSFVNENLLHQFGVASHMYLPVAIENMNQRVQKAQENLGKLGMNLQGKNYWTQKMPSLETSIETSKPLKMSVIISKNYIMSKKRLPPDIFFENMNQRVQKAQENLGKLGMNLQGKLFIQFGKKRLKTTSRF